MRASTWTIGQLAARTGLPVKTVRYYSDIGLLPVAERSAGGHRRYRPEALEQLHLVQRLRAGHADLHPHPARFGRTRPR